MEKNDYFAPGFLLLSHWGRATNGRGREPCLRCGQSHNPVTCPAEILVVLRLRQERSRIRKCTRGRGMHCVAPTEEIDESSMNSKICEVEN